MKLATLNDGSRDGQLVVVSRDLCSAHYATGIADHLQQVLDDWNFMSPQLQDLSHTLNHGKARHAFPFDARLCMAPLPRAHLLAQGEAFASSEVDAGSANLTCKLRLGYSDELFGASAPLTCARNAQQLDFEAALAVITGDVPQGASADQALDGVRLLLLANHVQLRAMPAHAVASSPMTALSPVAVTPDELVFGGDSAWVHGRLSLTLQCLVNGRKLGLCDVGQDMTWHFGELISALCQSSCPGNATRGAGKNPVVGPR